MSTIIGIIIIFINVIIRGQVPSRLLGHSWHRSKQSDVFTGSEVHHLDNEVGDDSVDYLETDQTVQRIPIMMMPMTLMMKILQVISRLVLPYLGDEVTLLHLLKSTHLHQYWLHPCQTCKAIQVLSKHIGFIQWQPRFTTLAGMLAVAATTMLPVIEAGEN